MNLAQNLFLKLQSFRSGSPTSTPEQSLLTHCSQVLSSVEGLHFDYKEKDDRRFSKLDDSDKKNLAKAVSGFANSGGGVLIWGIKDGSLKPKPISDIEKFTSVVLELAHQVTDPSVPNIDGGWIPSDNDPQAGYCFIFIPESDLPPHRVVLKDKDVQNHYYFRSGSSFPIASHTQLEDMFGRRPRPKLDLHSQIEIHHRGGDRHFAHIILGIENTGRGVAKSPMLAVNIQQPYHINAHGLDRNRGFGLTPINTSFTSTEKIFGAISDFVIHSGVIHDVVDIMINLDKTQHYLGINDVIINYKIASENIRLIEGQKIVKKEEIRAAFDRQT